MTYGNTGRSSSSPSFGTVFTNADTTTAKKENVTVPLVSLVAAALACQPFTVHKFHTSAHTPMHTHVQTQQTHQAPRKP